MAFQDRTAAAGLAFRQHHGGCGLRYFVEQVAAGAALLDADGDGALDLYFPQPTALGQCRGKLPEPLRHRLFLNDGSGHFRASEQALPNLRDYGIGAAVGDYDNDGDPDLFVACQGQSHLLQNQGDGTWHDVTSKARIDLKGFATGAAFFDYDRDGWLDLYVLRYCEWSIATDIACPGPDGKRDVCTPLSYTPSTHVLLRNNGDGTFSNATKAAGMKGKLGRGLSAAAADFNLDGWLDLFVSNDLARTFCT